MFIAGKEKRVKSQSGGIGRRAGLKIQWGNSHGGSIPPSGTIFKR